MLQLVVHPASAMAVGTWRVITFCLSSSSLVHAGGNGKGTVAWEGMFGFGIGGACVMRLASALTSEFSKHARITVDVDIVLFSLLNLELRHLVIRAFLKFTFCFCGG